MFKGLVGVRRFVLAAGLAVVVLLVGSVAAQAATFTVNTTADNAPTALLGAECAGAPTDCGLRQAIDKANKTAGDDTVSVPAGHYTLTITGTGEDADQTGDLDITGSIGEVTSGALTLTGAGARSTTIDGGGIDRVLQVQTSRFGAPAGSAMISGVTITGGAEPSGAGGGIENDGILSLDASTVTGNSADAGGGIYNDSGSSGQTLLVSNSTISANTARSYGGGMDFDRGDGRIVNTSIVNNVAKNGSSGTIGGDSGGAMEIESGNLTFSNDTIAFNRVTNTSGAASTNPTDAGGVELYGDATQTTTPVFENTIIAKNTPSDCHARSQGFLPRAGVNLDSDSTCFNGSADKHADPMLGSPADNGGPTDTLRLLSGSPAIDSADNALCPATDQRGVTRPQNSVCDIGAYEKALPLVVTNAASGVTTSSAKLNGSINPQGLAATYRFQFGTSTSYGSVTPTQSAGSGMTAQAVFAGIKGLKANTTYHFRLTAQNVDGSAVGIDRTFKTKANPAPAVRKLKLSVSPRNPRAGHTTCYTFTVTSSGHRVSGATVRFAHRTARTSHTGRARICVSLRAGFHTARASKSGYRAASTRVRVRAAPAAPRFTG